MTNSPSHCEVSARKSWQSILTRLLRPIVLAIEGAGLSLQASETSVAIHKNPLLESRFKCQLNTKTNVSNRNAIQQNKILHTTQQVANATIKTIKSTYVSHLLL
ncbi:hypothetical protein [Helicobacter fennelliae]